MIHKDILSIKQDDFAHKQILILSHQDYPV